MNTTDKSLLKYLFPRIQDGLFVGILIAILLQGPALLNADGDLGRHITIGKYIIENRTIPTMDIFSHTLTGERLVPHEWLAQLILGGVHALAGLSGNVLLTAALIAATFTWTYLEIVRRNIFRLVALTVAMLAASASSLHWIARPHIFTFLFVALWSYQLEKNRDRVWVFPVIMLMWANTHGAFIAGFVIWGAHLAGWLWEAWQEQAGRETVAKLLMIGALSFAVTFINPAGWRLWDTSIGYFGSQFLIDQTIEYRSPNFHNWSTWPFLTLLTLCLLGSGFGVKLKAHESILLAGWTVLSLYSARNIPLFAIIAAPYAAMFIQGILYKFSSLHRMDEIIIGVEKNLRGILYPALAIAVTIVMSFTPAQANTANQFDPDKFPVHAADWLETNPQEGRMFNNFIWGGYLLYRLWPQQTVFIDGQTDFYGEDLTRAYVQVTSLEEGWEGVLEKYDVSWVIVRSDKPLANALKEKMNWKLVYQDNTAAILHKP